MGQNYQGTKKTIWTKVDKKPKKIIVTDWRQKRQRRHGQKDKKILNKKYEEFVF